MGVRAGQIKQGSCDFVFSEFVKEKQSKRESRDEETQRETERERERERIGGDSKA